MSLPAPIPENDAAVAVHDLSKIFAVRHAPPVAALEEVSLTARRGAVTGLVGPDGAGKTTLLRIAAGLLRPTTGRVTVLGLDSTAHSLAVQGRVGYMPQKFGLYQELTVQENLDLYADLQGVPPAARGGRFAILMRMTGLGAFGSRRAGALSGGMKQKLGLACALVKAPEALLLDEPTVGVDPVSRRELWRIVYALVEEEGIGVLLSTAYLDEAERCHHVVVLQAGRKLAEGPPADFRARVRGRVFLATPSGGLTARRIQTRLVGREGVLDATIRSGRVRVVSAGEDRQALAAMLPELPPDRIQPAAPVFEDAFMALARRESQIYRPEAPAGAAPAAGAAAGAVVQVRELRKFFGSFEAVRGISFDVRRGEIFGLLGPNGAGKSTTFLMLCGLLKASAGEVRVAGRNLRRARAKARQRLGYMAQHFSLYGQLSVAENLRFFGKAYGLWGRRLAARLAWAEAEFGLGPRRDTAAGALPGGFKQRLAMAAALLHEPEILFLDEPTSGVDPLARREFWARINGFAEQGMTVVVTTHFMEEAEYCDRMLIMSQGATLALGTPAAIRALARTPERPAPTIEDAFIDLAEGRVPPEAAAGAGGAGEGVP